MIDIQLENESSTKLKEILEVLTSYLPGVHNMYFEEDEVNITEIDKTSVIGFNIRLKKSFFKGYDVDMEENIVSVDLNDMNDILEKSTAKSQLSITLEENDERLTFKMAEDGKDKVYRIPLMENIDDFAEKATRGRDKKLTCSMVLEEGVFSKILKDLSIGDDIRKFIEIDVAKKTSQKKAKFNLYEKPDSNVSAEVTITKDGGIRTITKVKEDHLGQYDMDYLEKLKKLDTGGDCVLEFTPEGILRLKFERDNYDFIFFSAPIDIEPDEDEDDDDEEEELEE